MKFLKRSLGFCFIVLFVVLPTVSLADDPSPTVKKKEETVGRVILESKAYPLDHYKMEAVIGDGLKDAGDQALHAINQGMWGFNKTIASFTLYSTNQLMSFDLISTIVSEASIMSERIYEIMSGTFLSLFVIFVGGTAAWRYFVNQQVGHAVKAIIGALAIMVVTFWFYSDATDNIKWLNDRGAELEGIASSVNVLVSSDEFDSNAAYNPKEGIAVLDNQLFNLMVKRPYLLLNYGSTKESEIVGEDPNRVDKLLTIKPYSEEGKEERKRIVKDEVSNYDNKQMTPDFSGERFGYLIITILSTIALAIPVLLLGTFKFLLQVWFLALVIFTAIPLILSILPAYSESALNHGKKLVGVLLMKAGLVLLIAVITGIITLLYESVKVTNGVEGYGFVVFLICITMWGLFKYRTEIFEVASAGMVHGQQMVERTTTNTFHKLGDAGGNGFKGAKRMVSQAYRNHQRKTRHDELLEGRKAPTNDAVNSRARSEHRKAAVGETNQKTGSHLTALSKGSFTRSSSRNPGTAIVHLEEYRHRKGERANANHPSNRLTDKPRKNRPSSQTTGGTNRSSQRKSSGSMNSKNEVAASREPSKSLTKWEAQQQVNRKKAKQSTETIKRSESRKPMSRDPKRPK
ncbi:CD3337/EF1877 family mobilome membrane protein [Pseudalkalibacillus sp. R45]|uniref:CD3337/EF1877 family mobilome membrane protein n=1 Tax=Pseudalkalibacillus sp. R45 TaxID=3457433 RepID=UPI003FCC3D81